jgi:5-methylcytosine-specific restriction endonuclease McrA
MSIHFTQRLKQGYSGTKTRINIKCRLSFCDEHASKYKGKGSYLCEHHQSLLREYGGPARTDRPWTFHKKKICESCGHDPWEHPMVKKISDELIRDRVAWGMLIVDHIHTQRDGGEHIKDNVQTLCLDCNLIKSTLAGDMVPKKLYKNEKQYNKVLQTLKPHYEKVFGK